MRRLILFSLILLFTGSLAGAQKVFVLPTKDNGPDFEFDVNDAFFNVSVPTITMVEAGGIKGAAPAVIICPGGGYLSVGKNLEGFNVANYLADRGITCFVLKYRTRHLGNTKEKSLSRQKELMREIMGDSFTPEGQNAADNAYEDAIAAMELVRSRASEFNVDPDRVGIVGFSAGALVAMRVELSHTEASAPNVVAPIYLWRQGDFTVPEDAAPLFLSVPQNDLCPTDMSYKLYKGWSEKRLPAEIHVLSGAYHGHGYQGGTVPSDVWIELFYSFLRKVKFVD